MVNKVVYNNNAYYRKLGYCRQTARRPVYTCTVCTMSDLKYNVSLTCSISDKSGLEKQAIFWIYASISRKRYEIRPKLLLTTNRKLYNALSIGIKVDDFG